VASKHHSQRRFATGHAVQAVSLFGGLFGSFFEGVGVGAAGREEGCLAPEHEHDRIKR
jgi:hypothetical protein